MNIKLIKGYIKLKKDPKLENFGIDNIILENSILRNTEWVLGIVLFMKEESLQMRNVSTFTTKKNYFKKTMNSYMLIFLIQIIILATVYNIKSFNIYF